MENTLFSDNGFCESLSLSRVVNVASLTAIALLCGLPRVYVVHVRLLYAAKYTLQYVERR